MPSLCYGQIPSKYKVLTSLLFALVVMVLAGSLLLDVASAQGWRGRQGGARGSWNAPHARWTGRPALQQTGPLGSRFTGDRHPGAGHDLNHQADHQKVFGQR